MRWHGKRFQNAIVAVVLLLAAACATQRDAEGDRGRTTVTVVNDVQPPSAITVWITTDIGTRTLLGHVNPASTGTLSYAPSGAAGQHQLVARTTGGAELVSPPFSLVAPGEGVRWDLSSNIVTGN